mmetsp:Transcript_1495/g.3183  ORF Transcript_1495/g.3183 Transcript_1495/m.3183 type:complete len:302 (+) Transcript_1495:45-950(+)
MPVWRSRHDAGEARYEPRKQSGQSGRRAAAAVERALRACLPAFLDLDPCAEGSFSAVRAPFYDASADLEAHGPSVALPVHRRRRAADAPVGHVEPGAEQHGVVCVVVAEKASAHAVAPHEHVEEPTIEGRRTDDKVLAQQAHQNPERLPPPRFRHLPRVERCVEQVARTGDRHQTGGLRRRDVEVRELASGGGPRVRHAAIASHRLGIEGVEFDLRVRVVATAVEEPESQRSAGADGVREPHRDGMVERGGACGDAARSQISHAVSREQIAARPRAAVVVMVARHEGPSAADCYDRLQHLE